MDKIHTLWQWIRRNKYWVVLFFIVLIVGFVDENSLMAYVQRYRHMELQRREIRSNQQQYALADSLLHQLDKSPLAVEKVARERYMMKRPDEDIFVLSSDLPGSMPGEEADSVATEPTPHQ